MSLITTLSARKEIDLIIVVSAGQSNANGLHSSAATGSDGGKLAFEGYLQATFSQATEVSLLNGSEGGSYASKRAYDDAGLSNDEYWWDDVSVTPAAGPELTQMYTTISNAGYAGNDVTAILWSQGEADGARIPSALSQQEYKAALLAIFNHMRATLGIHLFVVIQPIGRRATTDKAGWKQVREAQRELAEENGWIILGAELYDLGLYDEVHLDDAGYVTAGNRMARVVARQLQAAIPSALGAEAELATLSGSVINLQIAHEAGDAIVGIADKTPDTAGGLTGFFQIEDAQENALIVDDVSVTGGDSLEITLDHVPVSGVTLYGGYEEMANLDADSIIADNSSEALPLRCFARPIEVSLENVLNIPSLEVYLDAIDSSFTLDGSNHVVQWSDLSGNGNHATQVGSDAMPVYVSDYQGYPAVYSNGDAGRKLDFLHNVGTDDDFTIMALFDGDSNVTDTTTGSTLNIVFSFGGANASDNSVALRQLRTDARNYSFTAYGDGSTLDGGPFTKQEVFTIKYDGSNTYAYVGEVFDNDSGDAASTARVLGNGRLFNEDPENSDRTGIGWMRCFLMFKESLSPMQQTALVRAMQARYTL